MKKLFSIGIGILVVVILALYGCTYQIAYDQVAVRTTLGRDVPPGIDNDGALIRTAAGRLQEPGSVNDEPGLHLRWIWPIDDVAIYSTKLQVLTDEYRQLQTADGNTVIVRSYMTWRIENPHAFRGSLTRIANAESKLTALLQTVVSGEIGRYRFNDLVSSDPANPPKIREIERNALEALQRELTRQEDNYGVRVEYVGLRRVVLPQDVTAKVFDRMKLTRESEATKLRTAGEARAAAIRSDAQNKANTIMSFAQERSEVIRSQGDQQAAQYFRAFQGDEELAIFLQQIEALKEILRNNTTFVFDTREIAPFSLFGSRPSAAPAAGQ